MNIYIGNLSYRSSEADIKAAFENYGTVSAVNIITDRETGRSKGFGFVEMPNDSEALAAIEGLNGTDQGGRNINVNQARPREERSNNGGGNRFGGRRFQSDSQIAFIRPVSLGLSVFSLYTKTAGYAGGSKEALAFRM